MTMVTYTYAVCFAIILIKCVHGQTLSWTQIIDPNGGSLPEIRNVAGATYYNDYMIIFGGAGNSGKLNDAWRLNLKTKAWELITTSGTKPSQRQGPAAVQYNDEFVIIGGQIYGGQNLNTAFKLNLQTNKWNQLSASNAPNPRCFHTAVLYKDDLILYGGTDNFGGKGFLDGVWKLNLKQPTAWEEISISGIKPAARGYHTAVIHNDDMIIFGGQHSTANGNNIFSSEVWSLNLKTNIWTLRTATGTVPHGLQGTRATIYGDLMILFGGRPTSGSHSDEVVTFNLNTNEFTKMTTTTPPERRMQHSSVIVAHIIINICLFKLLDWQMLQILLFVQK